MKTVPLNLFEALNLDKFADVTKVYGVVVGLVCDNQDPENLGRVRIMFHWLDEEIKSNWAQIATIMAGDSRGCYFLPEVNDQVLVAFDHGDMRFPYVIGALWNSKDKPPANNSDGKNNIRIMQSRCGHIVRLDDTDGSEKIEIIDKTGDNSLTFESSSNNVTLTCNGKLKLQAEQGIEISSQADVKIQATTTLDMEASGETTIKGQLVAIN